MISQKYPCDGPVMTAAQKSLMTGDASHILTLMPEEAGNTVRNLLEKACCHYRMRKDSRDPAVLWYFRTVDRLHSARTGTDRDKG
jgi:hypothetical protein